tara:strand:+ start:16 stop:750 length:735 start_codon:yes stop_codon:yes gene_type:complete
MQNKSSFFIVGKHAVIEALKNAERKVLRVFLTEESKKNIHKISPKINLLKDKKVYFKTKKELDKYCSKEDLMHQGFVAEIEHLNSIEIKKFIENKKNLNLVCLDGVTDPRNIGSIIRSAVSFEIDGLIIKDRNFPAESKLMYKTASGSMEYMQIFKVPNIKTTIKYLKEKNFWVYAFDSNTERDFTDVNWTGNNILLFGSEGFGIKKHTEKYADYKVKININKKIESLNIANSTAIVFHHIKKK